MDLSWIDVVVAFAAVLLGAAVQGAIGFGMNLLAVPVIALLEPEALPATVVMLAFPLTAVMARHEHHAVDRRGLAWIMAGRLPGTLVGAWAVAVVSTATLSVLIGGSVLLAVGLSLAAPPLALTPVSMGLAGMVSGAMGTASGIGGPPLALLYQHHEGPVMRSTLAYTFALGTTLSLVTLAAAGEVTWGQVGFAALLAPAAVAGASMSRRFTGGLDAGWLRPAVLGFAAVSALVVVIDGLR